MVLVVVASFTAFAGMPPWATLPLLICATTLWIFACRREPFFGFNRLLLDWSLAMVALAIALQLVPLPSAVVNLLSPHAIPLSHGLRLDGTIAGPQGFRPLTLDVNVTLAALATVASVILTFVGTRTVLSSGGVRTLCRTLLAGGAVLAVVSVVLRAVWPDRLYGIWLPDAASARPLGPFVNRNHFAGWVLLLLPLGAGYFVAQLSTRVTDARIRQLIRVLTNSPATATAAAVAVLLLVMLLTLSRSAWLGLAAAGVVLWRLGRRRGTGRRVQAMVIAVAGMAVLAVLLLFVDPGSVVTRVASTFTNTTTSRSVIWRETLPIVQNFWLTGSGAGTFGAVMTAYQQTWLFFPHLREYIHFNQAHNHYLQVAAEGGLLLGIPVAIAIAAIARDIWRAVSHDRCEIFWVRAGAAASLVGIAVQSVVEIPLIAPANALLAAVLLGIALHKRER